MRMLGVGVVVCEREQMTLLMSALDDPSKVMASVMTLCLVARDDF